MRRILPASLLLCFFASPLCAQYTTVTGQVKDVNGLPYAGAQMKAVLVLTAGGSATGKATVTITNQQQCISAGQGGQPCQVPIQGTVGPFTLDGAGNIPSGGMLLADNTQVQPASTQWLITVAETPGVPPPFGTGPQICTAQLTISGATQGVSASFSVCPSLAISPIGGASSFDASAQTAAIGSTPLFTSISSKSLYRISMHARVTTAAGTSSTLGPVTVSWTDAQLGAQSSIMGNFNSADGSTIAGGAASGNLTTTKLSSVLNIDPAPSTNVTFTVGYASSPANAMNYAIHIRVELLGTFP